MYMKCNAFKTINHTKNLEKYEHFGLKTNTNIKFTIHISDRTKYIRNLYKVICELLYISVTQ